MEASTTQRRTETHQMSLQLTGRVGQSSQIRYNHRNGGDTDNSVLNFSLAHSRYAGKDGDGNARIQTTWFDVVVFGPRATQLHKLLQQGDLISVKGRIEANPRNADTVVYERDGSEQRTERPRMQIVPDVVGGVDLLNRAQGATQATAEPAEAF